MLLEIEGATLEDIREALSLLDPEPTVNIVPERTTEVDPNWLKLPATGSQRQAVLLYFFEVKQSTRELAKGALGITSEGTTRVHELVEGGFLSETGEYWTTANGKRAAVLAPTEKARLDLRRVPKGWFPGGVRPAGC